MKILEKEQIKLLCEEDLRLQWWAMVLFAEIYTIATYQGVSDKELASMVKSKVEEFHNLIIHRQIEKVKEKVEGQNETHVAAP